MLPEDPDWFSNDGNEPITHDWTNAVELGVEARLSATADGTFPAPAGTTLPWGGGRLVYFQDTTGALDGTSITIDSSLDYQNRTVCVLEAYAQDAANKIPGGGAEPLDNGAAFLMWSHQGNRIFWTGTGLTEGSPPAAPGTGQFVKWQTHADAVAPTTQGYVYVDTVMKRLMFRNASGATLYPVFLFWVSDQHPTRT